MDGSTIDTEAVVRSVNSINDTVSSYYDSLDNLNSDIASIKSNYDKVNSFRGMYLDNITTFDDYNPNNNNGGHGIRITYDDLMTDFSGGEDIPSCVQSFNQAYERFTAAAKKLDGYLKDAVASAENAESTYAAMEQEMAASFGGGGGGYAAGGAGSVAGGGAASLGKLSTPTTKPTKKLSSLSSDKATLGNHANSFDKSSSRTSDRALKQTTDVSKMSDQNRYGQTTGNSRDASRGSSSGYSDRNHSGGSFGGTTGYHGSGVDGDKSKTDKSGKDGLLKDASASIDDIISGKKKNRVASSSIPILGSEKIKGSAVIPVVSGLSAAGASGLGLTALMGKKKDDDDDDDIEDFDENVSMRLEDITKKDDNRVIRSIDEIDPDTDHSNDRDTFSSADLISSNISSGEMSNSKTIVSASNTLSGDESEHDFDDFFESKME